MCITFFLFRDTLQRSINEATSIQGFSAPSKLPEAFVREALLISDMYNLNEMSALSLLKSAEEEKSLYPGLPRGLVAVLFYYDSREQFCNALKTLVQARQGISWTLLEGNEELSASITRYMKSILNLNMVDKILEMIDGMDLAKEVDLLQQNRALGDARHRRMVLDKFKSVRSLLAETLFCWAAQTPLEKEECRRVMAYLSKVKLSETADGSIDSVTVTLLMALLYSIESGHLLAVEDLTDSLSSFPITADKSFVPDIHRELKSGRDWECRGLKAIVQFAWAVSLANLRQITNNIQLTDFDAYLDDDELMLSEALKGNVFSFLEKAVLSKSNLPLESFYCRRLHNIFADFIHRMPDRIKVMKTKADENAQNILAHLREGLEVPSHLDQPFEQLLSCLSALYSSGECSEFINEYWSESPTNTLSSRQVALKNFVQLPRDFLPHSLFIPYVKFLKSLSSNNYSSQRVYDYLRFQSRSGITESNLSWDHFLSALSKYYQNLRVEQPAIETIYRSSKQQRAITPQELEGLVSVLQLMATVAANDETARVELSARTSFSTIELCVGLLTCCVPMSLKTQLMRVLAAFALSPSVGVAVWQCLEASGIVPAVEGAPGYSNRGIKQDIEEVESSAEEFPLSQAFVVVLTELANSGIFSQMNLAMRGQGAVAFLQLVKQHIFVPHDSRTYRKAEERWNIAKVCCTLFHKLIMDYKPAAKNAIPGYASQPGHQIVLDFIHDSNLLKQMLNVLHDAVLILEQHVEIPGMEDLQVTVKLILEMLLQVLKIQRIVINSEENGSLLLVGLDKLLLAMNPRSGNCDHLLNVTKLMGHHAILPRHAALACELLSIVGGSVSGHKHLMPLLTAPSFSPFSRQYIVQLIDHATLDDDHTQAAKSALKLFKTFFSLPAPNLGHFFFGFLDGTGIRSGELRSDLLEPGVRSFPRTALHAILSVLPSLPPQLAELALSLLHSLATHHSTADALLRYLSSRDFVFRSLGNLPVSSEETPLKILSTSWILKLAALDLRYHASHQQRSQLLRLINLLVSGSEGNTDGGSENVETWVSNANVTSSSSIRGIFLSLLEVLELNVDPPLPLQCEFLSRAPELIKACEEGPNSEINIEMLYQQLSQVLQESGAAGAPLTQKAPLEADMQAVLDHALARNAATTLLQARRSLVESYVQLLEVAITVSPRDIQETTSHRAFLHTITLELLRRILDDIARPDLSSILLSTVLILVTTLKSLYAQEKLVNTQNYGSEDANGESVQVPSSLVLILRMLVDCVSRFRHSHQSVRTNVYASLLNFLHIHNSFQSSTKAQSLIIATTENNIEQYQRESYDVVKEEMPQILSVLCCEATAGHHLCRMLAITCIGSLAALEARANSLLGVVFGVATSALLEQLCQQGQLQRLLDGIEQDDALLVNLVSSGGDHRPLYVWEARCALFSQLALTGNGARLLLQSGLMSRFSKLQVLSAGLEGDGGITLSVVSGALRVCEAIVSSLSSDDWSAGMQVAEFLTTHLNIVGEILQPPSKSIPIDALALVAGVVASTAAAGLNNPSVGILYQQLLNLLPYLLPPHCSSLKDVPGEKEDKLDLQLQVLTSCLTCCRHYLIANPHATTVHPSIDDRNPKLLTLGTLLNSLKFATTVFADIDNNEILSHETSQQKISEFLANRRELCTHIAENAAFIFWKHLVNFLQASSPFTPSQSPRPLHGSQIAFRPPTKMLTPPQMNALKDQLNEIFSEVLPGLQNLQEKYAAKASDVAFLPAITSRIRKILIV